MTLLGLLQGGAGGQHDLDEQDPLILIRADRHGGHAQEQESHGRHDQRRK